MVHPRLMMLIWIGSQTAALSRMDQRKRDRQGNIGEHTLLRSSSWGPPDWQTLAKYNTHSTTAKQAHPYSVCSTSPIGQSRVKWCCVRSDHQSMTAFLCVHKTDFDKPNQLKHSSKNRNNLKRAKVVVFYSLPQSLNLVWQKTMILAINITERIKDRKEKTIAMEESTTTGRPPKTSASHYQKVSSLHWTRGHRRY